MCSRWRSLTDLGGSRAHPRQLRLLCQFPEVPHGPQDHVGNRGMPGTRSRPGSAMLTPVLSSWRWRWAEWCASSVLRAAVILKRTLALARCRLALRCQAGSPERCVVLTTDGTAAARRRGQSAVRGKAPRPRRMVGAARHRAVGQPRQRTAEPQLQQPTRDQEAAAANARASTQIPVPKQLRARPSTKTEAIDPR